MLSPRVDDEDDGEEKGLITITERFDCDIDERKEEDKASILMKSDFFFFSPCCTNKPERTGPPWNEKQVVV